MRARRVVTTRVSREPAWATPPQTSTAVADERSGRVTRTPATLRGGTSQAKRRGGRSGAPVKKPKQVEGTGRGRAALAVGAATAGTCGNGAATMSHAADAVQWPFDDLDA